MGRLRRLSNTYCLDEQIGFLLRRATQRHLAIFAAHISDLTPTQFAALAKLCEIGPVSQNALGRATAMDGATIKGVVDRLQSKGLVNSEPDADDRRRLLLAATEKGQAELASLTTEALEISAETLKPLSADEQTKLLALLRKLC